MGTYTGFHNFLNEITKELGYEYIPQNDANALFTTVLIRKLSKNIILRWKIDNSFLFSEQINEEITEKLKTLFFNDIWIPDLANIDRNYLHEFFTDNFRNQSPESRILAVLNHIYKRTSFAGDRINIPKENLAFKDQYWRSMFFNTFGEFAFYIETAQNKGFINWLSYNVSGYAGIQLTASGINEIISLENESHSKICFVAMSFDEEMFKVYDDAIKPAILKTGFEPLIISEKKNIPSDSTINDAILSAIKKSKFTIADFTKHKGGVYFESGYALGRGQKVIYTCRVDEITKAHFDTRNYPHIVWKDAEDLKKQLIDKIEVFIKA